MAISAPVLDQGFGGCCIRVGTAPITTDLVGAGNLDHALLNGRDWRFPFYRHIADGVGT